MKYTTGAAFRRAVEDRLRQLSFKTGVALVRLRKMVVFDRFLARLIQGSPNEWVLKGGLALQLRLEDRARTTKDIDLLDLANRDDIHHALLTAGALDMGDWFAFEVSKTLKSSKEDFGGIRFGVRALLDGRMFEQFHLDIGVGDPIIGAIDYLKTPALLEFAGIQPTVFPCYPITQQIAEKVHALTRSYSVKEVSRVKDLVDILLMAKSGEIDGKLLRRALQATFDARQTHSLPLFFPDVPKGWAIQFRMMAQETGLNSRSLEDAENAVKKFLNPILSGEGRGQWDPVQWTWHL